MNHDVNVDRLLATWIEEVLPLHEPDDLLDRVLDTTKRRRPRPAWLAQLTGSYVSSNPRRIGVDGLRLVPMIALLGLLVAAAIAVAAIGVGHKDPSIVMLPSPPVPSPAASARPNSTPSAFVQSTWPGDRVPDELLGSWVSQFAPTDFIWFLRAGDSWCRSKVNTEQDCSARQFGASAATKTTWAIVTIVEGKLFSHPIDDLRCFGEDVTETYVLLAGKLTLTGSHPEACYSNTNTYVRPGASGRPTAPPEPAP
jgi:hypothetical protein